MKNREKIMKALHDYIDSLDDHGIYEFISEQSLEGPDVYGCNHCEKEYGTKECDEPGICEKRFLEWMKK